MKVSVNWIRLMNTNYGCSDSSELDDIDKLIEKIGLQLGAVEEVIHIGERYQGIVVAKVISAEKHPNADKLKVCMVDDGGKVKSVKRGQDGLIQIVCGAPNVKAGQLVAWIPPDITVPSTFDKDPFVLEAREIRGQISNGMIASGKELAINDDHEGILVIEEPAKPGQQFAEVYRLDDHIIDIENKMFTHRPDCFGLLGVARELAGIYSKPFKGPDWYREDAGLPADGRKNVLKLSVKNEVPKLIPRFCAVAVKDVKVGPSPVWLQSFLSRSGVRPINNIVDITNWFMLATAQPLHAYDYDKVEKGQIAKGNGAILGVRLSKKGEKMRLLGGKEVTLNQGAVVITDGQKPIGLGGIMGGADTEVDKKTKNIIFECANFDMNLTRKTAMTYGLFTDAATRFTKNQSPRQNRAVLAKTVNDTLQLVGGRIASPLIDDKHFKDADTVVKTDKDFINSRLGTNLATGEILDLLSNVEFKTKAAGDNIIVTVPFWRTDIEIPEDIVEEVGRLYGYDKLPVELPRRDVAPARRDQMLVFKTQLRDILRRAGANEVLTYSFVHGELMKKAGKDPRHAFHIRNAVSPDLQYYRLSLTPSLLEKVHANIRGGFNEFTLFEIGKAHGKTEVEDGLPKEFDRLSMILARKTPGKGAAFYWAKAYVDFLAKQLNVELRYESAEADKFKNHKLFQQMLAVYEPKRSALVFAGDKLAGAIGEFPASAKDSLKLPAYCAGAEMFLSTLQSSTGITYQPLNRFPELEQDFCLRSAASLSYEELAEFMARNLSHLSAKPGYHFKIEPLDIFQKANDKSHKQTTWRIILWHPERTLTTEETNKLLDELAARAKKELKAERV